MYVNLFEDMYHSNTKYYSLLHILYSNDCQTLYMKYGVEKGVSSNRRQYYSSSNSELAC